MVLDSCCCLHTEQMLQALHVWVHFTADCATEKMYSDDSNAKRASPDEVMETAEQREVVQESAGRSANLNGQHRLSHIL